MLTIFNLTSTVQGIVWLVGFDHTLGGLEMEMRLRDVLAKVCICQAWSVCMWVCVAAFGYMCTCNINVTIVNMYHGNSVRKC